MWDVKLHNSGHFCVSGSTIQGCRALLPVEIAIGIAIGLSVVLPAVLASSMVLQLIVITSGLFS